MHMNFGIDVINQIKNENPTLWTEEFQQDMIKLITKGVELETQYGRDTMPKPMLGMDAQKFEEYIKFIANRRFERVLGYLINIQAQQILLNGCLK